MAKTEEQKRKRAEYMKAYNDKRALEKKAKLITATEESLTVTPVDAIIAVVDAETTVTPEPVPTPLETNATVHSDVKPSHIQPATFKDMPSHLVK